MIALSEGWISILRSLPPGQAAVAFWIATSGSDRDRLLVAANGDQILTRRGSLLASQREIAAAVGVSRQVVRDTLAALLRARLVISERHGDASAPWLISPVGAHRQREDRWSHREDRARSPRDERATVRFDDDFFSRVGAWNPRDDEGAHGKNPRHSDGAVGCQEPTREPTDVSVFAATDDRSKRRTTRDDLSTANGETGSVTLTEPYSEVHPDPCSPSHPTADPVPALDATSEKTSSAAKRSDTGETERGAAKGRSARKSKRDRELADLDPRALKLADYLRRKILTRQPGHQLRTLEPWDVHPQRIKWSVDLDALAHRRAGKGGQVDEIFGQLRDVVVWAFGDQGASDPRYRVIIESPAALAEKIDRVLVRLATLKGAVDSEGAPPAPLHASGDRRLATAPDRKTY